MDPGILGFVGDVLGFGTTEWEWPWDLVVRLVVGFVVREFLGISSSRFRAVVFIRLFSVT